MRKASGEPNQGDKSKNGTPNSSNSGHSTPSSVLSPNNISVSSPKIKNPMPTDVIESPSARHVPHTHMKQGSFSNTNSVQTVSTVSEYVLLMYFTRFKDQALKAIDDFAYLNKGGDAVTSILEYESVIEGETLNISTYSSTVSQNNLISASGSNTLLSTGTTSSSSFYGTSTLTSAATLSSMASSAPLQITPSTVNSNTTSTSVGSVSTQVPSSSAPPNILITNSTNSGTVINSTNTVAPTTPNPTANNAIGGNTTQGTAVAPTSVNTSSAVTSMGILTGQNAASSGSGSGSASYLASYHYYDMSFGESGTLPITPSQEEVYENVCFTQLVSSFASVSKHSLNAMVESVYDWRNNFDCKPSKATRDKIEEHVKSLSKKAAQTKSEALLQLYHERKEMAVDYVYCCTVLMLLTKFQDPDISSTLSELIEKTCFDYFKKFPSAVKNEYMVESKKRLAELFSEIIGLLSIRRYQIIFDQFIINCTSPTADKLEVVSFLRGMKYLKLNLSKVDPLNKSVSFMKKIFDFCSKTRKSDIRIACFEAGANILSPLAAYDYKTGIDYREWFELLKNFSGIAQKYAKKSAKYYMTAYPFLSTMLCVSSQVTFLEQFWPHVEVLFNFWKSSKDKSFRLMALDCLIHIFGFYLKIVNENTHESVRKTSFDRLSKTSQTLFQPGKKQLPNPSNELVYDALVDIVVMIANNKLDFAMNHVVMELLKENTLSENTIIGLRSFMGIADQCEVNRLSQLVDEDHAALEKVPHWVSKLLERYHRIPASGTIVPVNMDEGDGNVSNQNTQHSTASGNHNIDRLPSPFSSIRSKTSSVNSMIFGIGTLSKIFNSSVSFLDSLGLTPYQEELSKLFSGILQFCDSNYGQLLLTNQVKSLQEVLSKEKFAGLRVFVIAIACIPRLVPTDYSPVQLMDLLCRCVIHQHKDIRDVAWEAMQQIIDYQPALSATLVHSYAEMLLTIDDFKNLLLEGYLAKLVILLEKWIQNLKPSRSKIKDKYKAPAVYGEYKNNNADVALNVSLVEATGLILLCNLNPNIRLRTLSMLPHLKTIQRLLDVKVEGYIEATLADVLDETAYDTIEKLIRKNGKANTVIEVSVQDFFKDPQNLYTEFLRELGKNVSNFCPSTARESLRRLANRSKKLIEKPQASEKDIDLWRNFITFGCSISAKETVKFNDSIKRKSREVDISKELYEVILPYVKNSQEKLLQAAVDALGGVHEDNLEILLEQLKGLESEAFDKQKKQRKKDFARTQLSRIYSRIAENISFPLLQEKEFVKEKLLSFIENNKSFLVQNNYNFDLQPLRYHLFNIIENMAVKVHYFPPLKGRSLETHRTEIFLSLIKWSGFGDANRRREYEEAESYKAAIEKLRDEEEKKKIEFIYKRRNANVTVKACSAVAAIMLGPFFDTSLDKISAWSAKMRFQFKHQEAVSTTSGESPVPLKNKEKPSLFAKDTLLQKIFAANKKDTSNTFVEDHSSDEETLGIVFMKWADEVLCSKEKFFRSFGQQAVENVLETNPSFLSVCVEHCFNCNTMVSQGYFAAIVEVFQRKEMFYDVASILTLIMYQLFSENRDTRDSALQLLEIVSISYFARNADSGNYPYDMSAGILDSYEDIQVVIANKLAIDHPEFAFAVLQNVFKKLEFIAEEDQKSILKCLVPWIPHLKLAKDALSQNMDQLRRYSVESQDSNPDTSSDTPRSLPRIKPQSLEAQVLEWMFDITVTYGNIFSSECKLLWMKLAQDHENISFIISYLLYRASTFIPESAKELFTICQKIVLYSGFENAKATLESLIQELHFTRDNPSNSGNTHHKREISPNNIDNLSPDSQYISRGDSVLVFCVEFGYYHAEHFTKHLAAILHYILLRMDHKMKIVYESAKALLSHLIHSCVILKLPHNGGTIQEQEHLYLAKNLLNVLSQHKNKTLWKRDRISIDSGSFNSLSESQFYASSSKNFAQLSSMVENVLKVMNKELREEWGSEALKWAIRSTSIHNVVRSYQIYRTLTPLFQVQDIASIMNDLKFYLEDILEQNDKNEKLKLAVAVEILDTLRDLIKRMDSNRLILFPQLFWLCVALLKTDISFIYVHTLMLLSEILSHLDILNELVQNVLKASEPKLEPRFRGIQPLIIKGIVHSASEPLCIELLSRIILLPCDYLFQEISQTRILMNLLGLLPWLCLHIDDDLQQKAYVVASQLAKVCEQNKLKKVGKVLLRYSKNYYDSQEKFLAELRRPFHDAFFPQQETEIFNYLEQLLESTIPPEYQKAVLLILHSIILYIDPMRSTIENRSYLLNLVADFINGPLWIDATRVLDASVRISIKSVKDKLKFLWTDQIAPVERREIQTPFGNPGQGTRIVIQNINAILESISNSLKLNFGSQSKSSFVALFDALSHGIIEEEVGSSQQHEDISLSTGLDMSDVESESGASDGETTEDDTEVSESDLLSSFSTSKYRLVMDLENNEEEDQSLKSFDEMLGEQLKNVKIISPYLPSL